jgi:chaperonin GroES
MSFIPLNNRVLVKPFQPEEVTSGGIILPDTVQEKPVQGEVLAVGGGRYSDSGNQIPMTVKVGDSVVFGKYSGTPITINDGEELLVMDESDILGIINN